MKTAIKLLAIGLVTIPMLAHAEVINENGNGFFIGAGVGQSKLRVTSSEFDGAGNADEAGFKLFGGYKVNDWFSLEAGYYKPGKVTEAEDGTSLSLDVDILQVFARATAPITPRLNVFGKAGLSRWDSDLQVSDGFSTGNLSDSGTDFTFGVGVGVNFNDNLSGTVEFEQTTIDAPIGDLPLEWRLQFISANIIYRF